MKLRVSFAAAAAIIFAAPVASAQDHRPQAPAARAQCTLRQYASLPLITTPDDTIAVSVTIAGVERKFLLTMGAYTGIMKSLSDELALSGSPLPEEMTVNYFGRPTRLQTHLPEMQIGAAHGKDLAVVMMPPQQYLPGMSGVLGVDILRKFDAELDFVKKQLNLFSQDHCPGKVVYWSDAYAVVPLEDDPVGYPTVKMQLDEKEVTVELVPQDYVPRMTFALARKLFGLYEHSADVAPIPRDDGGPPVNCRYPFKTLGIGGLMIKNPQIVLTGDSRDRICDARGTYTARYAQGTASPFCFGGADLMLSLNELSKLHLYFAFGEKKLYLTAASPASEPRKISP